MMKKGVNVIFKRSLGRSRSSKARMTKVERFLGTDYFHSTTHTELFFWCSNGISNDFELRYGASFGNSPHVKFCCKINKRLIEIVEPKAIFFESIPKFSILKQYFSLKLIEEHKVQTRKIDVYLLENKYKLINFDHLSALGDAIKYRSEVSGLGQNLLTE